MIIYKVTNLINRKVYIGQTVLSLEERKKSHYKEAKYRNNNNYFHNALNSYNEADFKWEILEDSIKNLDDLNNKEIFYISLYDATNKSKGYNLKSGGKNGGLNSIDTKIKIGNSTRKRWMDTNCAEKMLKGLIKGTETVKQKSLNSYKCSICINCNTEFKYKKDYYVKFCCNKCRMEYLKSHNKGLEKANDKNKIIQENSNAIMRAKILEWCKNNQYYFVNIKFNQLTDLFNKLKEVTGLKDERSIMKSFGFTSRKAFVTELSKIYAVQV